jgi:Electron transfer DM13
MIKRISVLLVSIVLIMASCKKEYNTPTVPIDDRVDTASASLEHTGNFMNGPYGTVSGMAKIYQENGKFILSLLSFMSSNGPALHVYLSKEVQPINFIDLGDLKSTNGNQLYGVTGSPDFVEYKYVLIHCKQYNHLFGSAELQ